MDYKAWSLEYWEEASRVRERMKQVREETVTAKQEVLRKRRMAILYTMYLDCVHIAKDLERRAEWERRC